MTRSKISEKKTIKLKRGIGILSNIYYSQSEDQNHDKVVGHS